MLEILPVWDIIALLDFLLFPAFNSMTGFFTDISLHFLKNFRASEKDSRYKDITSVFSSFSRKSRNSFSSTSILFPSPANSEIPNPSFAISSIKITPMEPLCARNAMFPSKNLMPGINTALSFTWGSSIPTVFGPIILHLLPAIFFNSSCCSSLPASPNPPAMIIASFTPFSTQLFMASMLFSAGSDIIAQSISSSISFMLL